MLGFFLFKKCHMELYRLFLRLLSIFTNVLVLHFLDTALNVKAMHSLWLCRI